MANKKRPPDRPGAVGPRMSCLESDAYGPGTPGMVAESIPVAESKRVLRPHLHHGDKLREVGGVVKKRGRVERTGRVPVSGMVGSTPGSPACSVEERDVERVVWHAHLEYIGAGGLGQGIRPPRERLVRNSRKEIR